MKAHLIPAIATEDRPVIGEVLSGYWYALTPKDRARAANIRPDLWAEMNGHIPAKVCGHMIPKWLMERLCHQHGMKVAPIMVIERGSVIHIVRGA